MVYRGIDKYLLNGRREPHVMMLVLLCVFTLCSTPAFPACTNISHSPQLEFAQQEAVVLAPINDQRGRHSAGLSSEILGQVTGILLPAPHITGRMVLRRESADATPLSRLLICTQIVASEL